MTDREPIDPSQIRPGRIRHETLPPELLEPIGAVHEILGPFLGTTLEQFEISFMRDSSPDQEIAIWCCIAAAWIVYHEQFLGDELPPAAGEKMLISALGFNRR